jgi:hypothetical protein
MRPVAMRTVAVKRIDIASAGMMLGALYALLGLIVGGIFSLMAVLGVAVGGGGGDAVMGGLIGGVGALIFLPIFYGVIGFIGGIIGALLYNLVAGIVGGIKIDLES